MERGRTNLPKTAGRAPVGLGWRKLGGDARLRGRGRDVRLGPNTLDIEGMGSPLTRMPAGVRTPVIHRGPESFLDVVQTLHDDVRLLAETIGERHDRSSWALANLGRAADAIETRFRSAHVPVKRRVGANEATFNIEATLQGGSHKDESIVIGAHYDSPQSSPGANDNASGVAVLLALAWSLQRIPLDRTVRLVAFATEPPPGAFPHQMGSARYVRDLQRERLRVTSMVSLESLGLYTNRIPWPLRDLPVLRSDLFLVGDRSSRRVIEKASVAFDEASTGIHVFGTTLPVRFGDVRSSDHVSFARAGIPSFMMTDTSPLWAHRYGGCDTAEKLDYERLGLTCLGITSIVRALANA